MAGIMALRLPTKLKLEAEQVDADKDIWQMVHTEWFDPKDKEAFEEAFQTIKRSIGLIPHLLSADMDNNCIILTTRGPRGAIFSNLVGEFLMNSDLGQMTLKDLLALAIGGALTEVTRKREGD